MQTMGRYLSHDLADALEASPRGSVLWLQSAERVSQFGEADGRVMADAADEEIVDPHGGASLQNVDVDGRVQQKRRTKLGKIRGPNQIAIAPSPEGGGPLLGFQSAD